MATCFKLQPMSGQMVAVLDDLTPVDSCAYLLINGSEYAQLSHGFITSRQDAESIAFAFVLAMAGAWGIRLIRNSLSVADPPSEERH